MQSSIAIGLGDDRWVLVNAAPDLRQQILTTPALRPQPPSGQSSARRHSPIAAVVLTNGDLDHIAGLLLLREGHRFAILAHDRVLAVLAENPVFGVLPADRAPRLALALDRPIDLGAVITRALGAETAAPEAPPVLMTAFAVPGKVPLYQEGVDPATAAPAIGTLDGDTIALEFRQGGRRALYIPGCADLPGWLLARIDGADLLLFDGTVWRDDELRAAGTGTKTGRRMGHLPIAGPGGSLETLAGRAIGQRVFVHINNTNPILLADSPERAELAAAGWAVADDGQAFTL